MKDNFGKVGSDCATEQRRRNLANSQPLQIRWFAVFSCLCTLLVALAIWRSIYLYGWRALAFYTGGFLTLYAISLLIVLRENSRAKRRRP